MRTTRLFLTIAFWVTSCFVFAGTNTFYQKMVALEAITDGKVGIYAIDTANNDHLAYRADEIFPTGCTSKLIGVAAILKKSMKDKNLLSKRVKYTKRDLANWNPITQQHLTDGMTIRGLCAAAIRYSDNTAMNLLVKQLGGVQEMNVFAKSIHNDTFRQDHDWPEEGMSGGQKNVHDTSTPRAMAESIKQIAFSNTLAQSQRQLLLTWLKTNTTGNYRIRAGSPKSWLVADKTGTGFYYGTTNDIGIVWPPQCKPIIIAIYYTSDHKNAIKREDVIAAATHLSLKTFAKKDACLRGNLVAVAKLN